MTKILLLNFTQPDAAIISKAGYDVERGYLGPYEVEKQLPFQAPHPIYEYDILVYNSQTTPELRKEFVTKRNLLNETGSLDALSKFRGTPAVRISFVGEYSGLPTLLQGGLSFVKLAEAEENVSMFFERPWIQQSFAIPEIHRQIAGFKVGIAKVGRFIVAGDEYPFSHFPVLLSRSGEQIAAYGTTYTEGTLPRYIILPQLKANARAVLEILQTLERVCPRLFPDRTKSAWLQSKEFQLRDERAKESEIEQKVAETVAIVDKLRVERELLAKNNDFIRLLLVTSEDIKVEKEYRLSSVVRKALEFLDFSVEDIDEKTKTAIKKEDFWVSDGDFFAITEVSGTAGTNPKVKEFNDILARIATIYRRKTDLIPEGVSDVSGLLVLNYDCERHPSKRPKAYTGDLEHIIETAIEQNIGILSTVELHKIVVAVKEGTLEKGAARAALKRPGRIVYDDSELVAPEQKLP
jgi:hypothetical protein